MSSLVFLLITAWLPVDSGTDKSPEQIYAEADYVVYLQVAYWAHNYDENGNITGGYIDWISGSGFIYKDRDGAWLLTAGHLVNNGIDPLVGVNAVYLDPKIRKIPRSVAFVGYDTKVDVALFQFLRPEDAEDLVSSQLGSSDQLRVGQQVMALGSPSPTKFSGTIGHVVSLTTPHLACGARCDIQRPQELFHTSFLSPGSSGGPLVNMRGEVVGINVGIRVPMGGNVAVPIDDVKALLPKLKLGGELTHPPSDLIRFTDTYAVHESDLQYLDLKQRPTREGVMIYGIKKGSLPEAAGFKVGDVVISCNGREPRDIMDLWKMLYLRTEVWEVIKVEIDRFGEKKILPLVLINLEE